MLPLKTILYHGTIDTISHIDVTKGRDRKDFGKGFYLATSKSQAIGMCVVDLTKYLMNKYNLSQDVAFAKLQGTVLFSLLNNQDSGLLFEYVIFRSGSKGIL